LNKAVNHKAYIELTNPIHGGEGWDLGEVLWSPAKDASGKDAWKILKKLTPGDIIFHSIKRSGKGHELIGVSIVKSSYVEIDLEPPVPGRWGGYHQYLKVPLKGYCSFKNPMKLIDFLTAYRNDLLDMGIQKSFYTHDIKSIAQKYVAELPSMVLAKLLDFIEKSGNRVLGEAECSDDTDNLENLALPARIETTTSRIIRDTKLIRDLKEKYDNVCQICGVKLQLPNGNGYSEGHHLQKLGGIHRGPDIKENIIILCPNHHIEFDYGMIAIKQGVVIHIDSKNIYHGQPLAYFRDDLDDKYLEYHYTHIFNR